jgi:hypothetical protein
MLKYSELLAPRSDNLYAKVRVSSAQPVCLGTLPSWQSVFRPVLHEAGMSTLVTDLGLAPYNLLVAVLTLQMGPMK